ncbi:hypothetical protein [Candidatus Korobacter versatilis]|uniref:hypothetical protein n=1 Tax=Candidatus Korobacter versatilis TaxID=658062 RepID=UPI0005A43AD2|nr:hypothetical protein [Candidatus Koribacter versatilis]
MVPTVRPQLFLDQDRIRVAVSDRDGLKTLISFIDRQIASDHLKDTRIFIDENARLPHYCMHRSDDAVVSASDSQLARKLLLLLQSSWTQIKSKLENAEESRRASTPEITIKLTFRPNDEYRGVAKIAFETLAVLFGPELVLRDEFNPVREYIRGEVKLPETVPPGEIAVDSRFVERLQPQSQLPFSDQHGVIVLSSPPNLVAFVLLYGEHGYIVRLANGLFDERWVRAYEFSYTRDGHRELNDAEFARRLFTAPPESFGVSAGDLSQIDLELGDG